MRRVMRNQRWQACQCEIDRVKQVWSGYVRSRAIKVVFLLAVLCMGTALQAKDDNMSKQQEQQLLQHPELITSQIISGQLSLHEVPDPHWKQAACVSCHAKNPDKNGLHLRSNDIDQVCNNCHEMITEHSFIHPSGLKPSKNIVKHMSREFKLAVKQGNGTVGCSTCHDLSIQCKAEKLQDKQFNPMFFRAGPYYERSAICYKCHDDGAYKRLNPHDQVTAHGEIRTEKCTICHRTLEGLKEAQNIDQVDFNLSTDLSKMCMSCHPWKPHPGGSFGFGNKPPPNHLVKPPSDMKKFYAQQQAASNVLLPLEPGTGKVFCGTCHNPHAVNVIKNPAAAKGAGSKQRLRMVDLCTQCHDK